MLDKTPTAHLFSPPLLGLISFGVIQIWYCSLDIRHTVRELADTQQQLCAAGEPATNPTSRRITTGFQLQHIIKLAASTSVTNTHSCVFQTLSLMPPLPSHHSKASWSRCPFLWPHTRPIQPHLIQSFFLVQLLQQRVLPSVGLNWMEFYWWVRNIRRTMHPS